MKCTLPQGWQHLDDEQLLEMSGMTGEVIKDETISQAVEEALQEGRVFFAMFAGSGDGRCNFNLSFERLNAMQTLALSEENYIALSEPQLKTSLESMGVTGYSSETVTVTMGGREMPAVRISGEINGTPLWELVTVYKLNGYMVSSSFTSVGEDRLEDMQSMWSPLE